MARPTTYTTEIGDILCDRLTAGESLVSICKEEDMPAVRTVYQWLRVHDEFTHNYVRARENQADNYAEEIIAIADTEIDPQKARVRIDARKWVSSKLKPKSYGDKIDVTSGGEKLPTPIIPLQDVPRDDSNTED